MTTESRSIRVLQYGLGPIGLETARAARGKPGLDLVGAIDTDPAKAGRDVGELLERDAPTGVVVSADATETLSALRPDVVLHATSSHLEGIRGQLESCATVGAHVISSCEELFFPFSRHAGLSSELDRVAKHHGVVFLGTGVNPGFVMDTLALAMTAACRNVAHVAAQRVVDASLRRAPLQAKVGAGLSREQFDERKQRGKLGHIGLRESMLFVADGLGWKLDLEQENLEPVLAAQAVRTPFVQVAAGQVAGIHHTVRGFTEGRERVSLDLKMYVGAESPQDAIQVRGDPPVDLVIQGGIFGDSATVATLINAIPRLLQAPPGLRVMHELTLPRAFGTGTTD